MRLLDAELRIADICRWSLIAAIVITTTYAAEQPVAPELRNIRAEGKCGRIDILWDQGDALFFEIERLDPGAKDFHRINKVLWTTNLYGDFIGRTSGIYRYRVRAIFVSRSGEPEYSGWSPVVSASPGVATTKQLLTQVQEASFRYFYHYRHPVSGLAREKTPYCRAASISDLTPRYIGHVRDIRRLCTTGATGMGMFNLVVGVERGFITRDEGARWALQMLRFLSEKAERFHGAFSHWLNGDTGKTRKFAGKEDNGADTVETAFLASGFIVLREYFTADTPAEREIRALSDSLWKSIEWKWFTRTGEQGAPLYWHWSPDYAWAKNHRVRGFNEAAILYILAVGSPTHAIHPDSYHKSWRHPGYGNERTEFDVPMVLGRGLGPPIFWTHYSYLGLDPRKISYKGTSYFEHFKRFCEVQVRYAQSKAGEFEGYGPLWGLTSSMGPNGYQGHRPGDKDDGTITPTAALSSMPYAPKYGVFCLKTMYTKYGGTIWKDFGFTDAFNLSEDWVADSILGIDAGPIAPMIENFRTGICWKTFMRAPEIRYALKKLEPNVP